MNRIGAVQRVVVPHAHQEVAQRLVLDLALERRAVALERHLPRDFRVTTA